MAVPKIIGAQRDFSSGELDETMKRADEMPVMKTGARQLANLRLLSGGQAVNRPGRRALGLETGRVEEIMMSAGNVFYLAFGDRYVRIYNAAWTKVAESFVKGDGATPIPWTKATAYSINFCVVPTPLQVVITYGHDFPFNVPLILTWDGVSQTSTWTISNFAESIIGSGQKRTIFDRLSPPNITIIPSGTTGAINLVASSNVFTAGWVGTHLLWCGREVIITQFNTGVNVGAQVLEQLPNTAQVNVGSFQNVGNGNIVFIPGASGFFQTGDLVEGSISGTRGIVINSTTAPAIGGNGTFNFIGTGTLVNVQVIPATSNQSNLTPYYLGNVVGNMAYFLWQEYLIGQNGSGQVGASSLLPPSPVSIWDDEVMNNFRGWPTGCFYDQNRLGFCGFADAPGAIAWSSIGLFNDFYVNGLATTVNADNAIFEETPSGRVQFVVPGMESSEFVFCDNAIYWILISPQFPLTPGSISFQMLTAQGSFPNVKPVQIQQSILYVRAGGASLGAVQTPGFYYRPNIVDMVSEMHSHLFTAAAPVALAAPPSPSQYEETYAYLLRADGVIVVSRYLIRNGLLEPGPEGKPKMGWVPWSGAGLTTWISAQGADLVLTTQYAIPAGSGFSNGFSNGFGGGASSTVSVVEVLDNTQYLDAGIFVNSPPPALAPPAGKGPLWYAPGQPTFLIDLGTRTMGVYQVDANGNIIPQFLAGENLLSSQLVAGQPWTATLEPFAPDAPAGASGQQRMRKRRVSRMTTYVSNSNGFTMAKLASEFGNVNAVAPGTEMNFLRIPAWNIGDNPAQPPPLREEAYRWRPSGRAYDPRVAVIKDTPGPLIIHEIGLEITV